MYAETFEKVGGGPLGVCNFCHISRNLEYFSVNQPLKFADILSIFKMTQF